MATIGHSQLAGRAVRIVRIVSDSDIIEQIFELWRVAAPIDLISRTLHIPESTVRHVLQYGKLPQTHPLWRQPEPDRISDK